MTLSHHPEVNNSTHTDRDNQGTKEGGKMTATKWSPPTGINSKLTPAGVHWDAVSLPGHLGSRLLARIAGEGGAVIRDPYGRRLTWLTAPGETVGWSVPEASAVQLLSTGECIDVPPGWRTRPSSLHWARPWTGSGGVTAAHLLHITLDAVLTEALGPRPAEAAP